MTSGYPTKIAAILLHPQAELAFSVLAQSLLTDSDNPTDSISQLNWFDETTVFLDFSPVRIALKQFPGSDSEPAFICIGMGEIPGMHIPESTELEPLLHGLVSKATQVIKASAVLWFDKDTPLTPEMLLGFRKEIEPMANHLRAQSRAASGIRPKRPRLIKNNRRARPTEFISMDPLMDETALGTLRDDISEQETAKESALAPALHASLYLMASSMIVAAPPVGVSLFSYIALRDALGSPSAKKSPLRKNANRARATSDAVRLSK